MTAAQIHAEACALAGLSSDVLTCFDSAPSVSMEPLTVHAVVVLPAPLDPSAWPAPLIRLCSTASSRLRGYR